ncbi:MAG: CoA transferase [Candidatus Tectomicrobia bacterium]|uniref:CoA transferase n=1 Tax=Tectimicrobiota bacterium TaxID=2528274 RepID=A0A938B584_UNCTE|nr:CoA transferase [Candidatus Tectomicrobia bacterium]
MTEPAYAGPLQGIRILDLTRVLAGPYSTMMLGDLGAEILKVEPPGVGDETRVIPPYRGGESHYFLAINRNKQSLVIDLKQEAGQQVLLDLVQHCDALIENYRPGVLARLGLAPDRLLAANPRLIVCSISGFGQTGPLRDRPSYDIVTQAMTGAMSVTGEPGRPPVKLGLPMGDLAGGLFAALGILAALQERQRTGRGQIIDVGLYDCMVGLLGYLAELYLFTGQNPTPVGSGHHTIVPYGAYQASDGYLVIALHSGSFYRKFCEAIGRPDLASDPRFATNSARQQHKDLLNSVVAEIVAEQPVASWLELLERAAIPAAPIQRLSDVLAHPQTQARQMLAEMQHPTAGTLPIIGRVLKFAQSQPPLAPAPLHGQHSCQVLRDLLGYSEEHLATLLTTGVIKDQQHDAQTGAQDAPGGES